MSEFIYVRDDESDRPSITTADRTIADGWRQRGFRVDKYVKQPFETVIVPREPTEEMLDRAVAFALNVSLSSEYRWTDYMRDLYRHMLATAPLSNKEKQ